MGGRGGAMLFDRLGGKFNFTYLVSVTLLSHDSAVSTILLRHDSAIFSAVGKANI
jgi:hypothetical protein